MNALTREAALRDPEGGVSAHIICAGAGAGAQHRLWSEAGASRFLSGAEFPYSTDELAEVLGFAPEHAVSMETAVDLAATAYMRGFRFGGKPAIGIGLTAAVATTRELRGGRRVFACSIDAAGVVLAERHFTGAPSRAEEGAACDALVVDLLEGRLAPSQYGASSVLERILWRPFFDRNGTREQLPPMGTKHVRSDPFLGTVVSRWAMMPGAYNPPHEAHLGIAEEVEDKFGHRVVYEIDAVPPHKDTLSPQDLLARAAMLRGRDRHITRGLALYLDKARAFPGVPIVLGSDALQRMLDPKWGPEISAMLEEFRRLGTTFYVSPRICNGGKLSLGFVLDAAQISPASRARSIFHELRYCSDVSSTALRAGVNPVK